MPATFWVILYMYCTHEHMWLPPEVIDCHFLHFNGKGKEGTGRLYNLLNYTVGTQQGWTQIWKNEFQRMHVIIQNQTYIKLTPVVHHSTGSLTCKLVRNQTKSTQKTVPTGASAYKKERANWTKILLKAFTLFAFNWLYVFGDRFSCITVWPWTYYVPKEDLGFLIKVPLLPWTVVIQI